MAQESGHNVESAYGEHTPQFGKPIRLDVTSETDVMEHVSRGKPDVVFNTASVTDVDFCEEQPDLAMRVNGEAIGIIARACKEYEAFLVHISTDYVFDGERGLYREGDKPAPINVQVPHLSQQKQSGILEQTLQTCRILYNGLLAERRDKYKNTGCSPS